MTIILQVGKRYKMRNGAVTGMMLEDEPPHHNPLDRFYTHETIDDFHPMWNENGRATFWSSTGDDHGGFDENHQEIVTPGQSIYDIVGEA